MTELATIDKAAEALAAELGADVAVLEPDAKLHISRHGESSLVEWYLEKLADLEVAEQNIKDHVKSLLADVERRRKSLKWRFGEEVKVLVDADLAEQGGQKRSVNYATGTAGYRKTTAREKVVVVDEAKAIAAAERVCPDAIKKSLVAAPIKKHYQATGELLDGCEVTTTEATDRFFVGSQTFEQKQLSRDVPKSDVSATAFFGKEPSNAG